jgi:solute carrier family 25 phosphate transporter 23/24/25/41
MDNESPRAQDARVDALWATLDTKKQGKLDMVGLKKGLRKLDHRMTTPRAMG